MLSEYTDDINRIHLLSQMLNVRLVKRDGLLMLESFCFFKSISTKEEYSDICNGAGAKGSGFLVPDSLYGLNMTIVFDLHDYCYNKFKSVLGKELSDLMMKVNMMLYIDKHTTKCPFMRSTLLFLREKRALLYYHAVDSVGGLFYGYEENKL